MNLTSNPLLPYIVSSLEFIQSINNRNLSEEQISFIYSNIKYVIDEHNAKEKLKPRFEEFISYTKISNMTSKTLETQDYSELYKYLETVSSILTQHLSIKNKSK